MKRLTLDCYWGSSTKFITDDASGTVSLTFNDDEDEVAYLWGLVVEEQSRKQGLGSLLMDAAESYAREKGYEYTKLCAELRTPWIIDWYERRGYKKIDMTTYPDKEERENVVYMYKELYKINEKS